MMLLPSHNSFKEEAEGDLGCFGKHNSETVNTIALELSLLDFPVE